MKTPSVTNLKKYLSSLNHLKKKYVTSEMLSRIVGVYPEVINETLSFFDPMVNMDYQFNLMNLVEPIEKYIADIENARPNLAPKKMITKKALEKYESVADFLYQKMTIGGIVDRNIILTDIELRELKKLIANEQLNRRNLKKKGK